MEIAIGCDDGIIRIYDMVSTKELLKAKLDGLLFLTLNTVFFLKTLVYNHSMKGHSKKVFALVWHPIYPNILAGGNDNDICIWDTISVTF